MADEAWTEHYYGQQPPHPTCGMRNYLCGPGCPRPAGPDPERDKRIDAYRDRERRRAARALDRYIDLVVKGDGEDVAAARVAGERLVEACGDYVLARLGHDPSVTQHKSNYGVPRGHTDACRKRTDGLCECGAYMGVSPVAPEAWAASVCPDAGIGDHDCAQHGHLKQFGATPSDEETHALDHWNRGVVRPGCRYCEPHE